MLVFDASASMAGRAWDNTGFKTRYASVRAALATVLPEVDRVRDLGLIVYGPGPLSCSNVALKFPPVRNAAKRIMADIDKTIPAGRTPLASAVSQAADLLDFRNQPATIVVITDGEDTCGGVPCALAETLAREGVGLKIHVIGYAPENSGASAAGSQCLATATGGVYVTARTSEELVAALRETLSCPQMSRLGQPGAQDRHAMARPTEARMRR